MEKKRSHARWAGNVATEEITKRGEKRESREKKRVVAPSPHLRTEEDFSPRKNMVSVKKGLKERQGQLGCGNPTGEGGLFSSILNAGGYSKKEVSATQDDRLHLRNFEWARRDGDDGKG